MNILSRRTTIHYKCFFIGLMKYSTLLRVNWWFFVKCEPKSSQLKEPKTWNYFSLCALNLFNTRVSQFELNYWNKSTFPRHSNLLRCTCSVWSLHVVCIWCMSLQSEVAPHELKCCLARGSLGFGAQSFCCKTFLNKLPENVTCQS